MKVALVTGASRGIGRACAERLAADGYAVAINYNNNEKSAAEALEGIKQRGGEGIICRADVSDPEDVKKMVKEVYAAYGQIDVLVNNAGVVQDELLLTLSGAALDKCLNVNVKGYFYCAQQVGLKMFRKKSGVIINMSSVSSKKAINGQCVYSATKGAVNSMTQTMARELAPYGIRVNAVAPGFIATDMVEALPPEKREEYLKSVPCGRLGTPEDVAAVVSALCGDDFAYMTGQTLVLDGGLSL